MDLSPLPLATLPAPGNLSGCVVVDDLCFAPAGEAGLLIIDISDASHPRQVGQCLTGGDAQVVVVSSNVAYVGDHIAGLQVIDVRVPQTPRILGAEPNIQRISGVAVTNGIAYVVNGGLSVVDVRNPEEPRTLGSYTIPIEGEDVPLFSLSTIVLTSHFALCGVGPSLWTFDVSDPAHPRLVGRHQMEDGLITGMAIRGNHVFASLSWHGLGILEISDPLQPTTLGIRSLPGFATCVNFVGSRIAVTTDFPAVYLYDFSTSANSRLAGIFPVSSRVNAVAGSGHHAYLAAGTNGLQTLDLIPANPQSGASPTSGSSMAIRGQIGLVGRAGSIGVVDLSHPVQPKEIANFNTGLGMPRSIAIGSDLACYLNLFGDIGQGGSFRTISLADPSRPRGLGSLDLGEDAVNVLLSGSTAFVAHRTEGLIAVNVSDPAHPQTSAKLGLEGGAQAIAIAEGLACLGSGRAGVHVVDLHDPAHPVRLGGVNTGGEAINVAMTGTLCAIGEADGQISLIDLSEPASPKVLGQYPFRGYLRSISLSNDLMVMSAYPGGIEVVDVRDPRIPRRLSGNASVEPPALIFNGVRIYISGYGPDGISILGPIRRLLWDAPGRRGDGPVDLRVFGLPGERFQVESSPDLEVWKPVGILEMADRPALVINPIPPNEPGQVLVRARPIP